jgi:hypothetical protein
MTSFRDALKTHPSITELSSKASFEALMAALNKGRAVHMIEACCCEREPQPELRIRQESSEIPKLLPYNCTHQNCPSCGLERRFGDILNHSLLHNSDIIVKCFEWDEADRAGKKKAI